MGSITYLPCNQITSYPSRLASTLTNVFPPGAKIGIKVHFGEPGNRFALTPQFMKDTVHALKKMDLQPFLFDSPVAYSSPRNSTSGYLQCLKERDMTPDTLGCPIIISNEGTDVHIHNTLYTICKHLIEAEGILVLSHVKGHLCTGFGGAIKNIGMGGMSKETKKRIHDEGKPVYTQGCTGCNQCVDNCPLGNIKLKDNEPCFNQNWCCGCSNCVHVCENGCINPQKENFDRALVQGVKAALERYPPVFYVNSLINITRLCDCVANPGPLLAHDIGILFGTDIVSIEKASLDLVISAVGEDVFKKEHKKTPLVHIKEAETLGLGHMSYVLNQQTEY